MELLSLVTAVCYGSNAVLTRKGLDDSNPLTAVLVSSLVQAVLLSILVAVQPPKVINLTGMAFFVASGTLASTLGRLSNFIAIEKLGVSVSSTIVGSSPLFSTLFAVIIINEKVSLPTLLGTLLVVAGVAITRLQGGESKNLKTSAMIFPLLAAVFYGVSAPIRKIGLNILPEATFGALVGSGSSTLFYALYLVATGKMNQLKLTRRSARYFVTSGFVVTAGWLAMYNALSRGNVSVVAALIGTNPLFSLLMSYIFLRSSERIDRMVVFGCLAIVGGAVIITLF